MSLIVICHMGTTINKYQISRNVEFGYWVLEHGNVPLKGIPVFVRDTIMHLVAMNRGKPKGTMNVCIQVGDVKPFWRRQKAMALRIVV